MRERAPAPPVFEERRPEFAEAAPAQDVAANGQGPVITIPRRHFPPRGSDLWERYQAKVAVVQEALNRAHEVRIASARCLTTSRQALMAARTVNTQALEASRRLLQAAQSGSRPGDLGGSVDFETLAMRSPQ